MTVEVIRQSERAQAFAGSMAGRPARGGMHGFDHMAFDALVRFRAWARERYGPGWEVTRLPADVEAEMLAGNEAAVPEDDAEGVAVEPDDPPEVTA